MITIEKKIETRDLSYPVQKLGATDDMLFLDMETTGFNFRNSCLYLIGCIYHRNESWNVIQFFADKYEDESVLLDRFLKFASSFRVLVHFNGTAFDLPFIKNKCEQFSLSFDPDSFTSIDLYKMIFPYRSFYKLPGCRQKNIEQYLGIHRKDRFSGKDLIEIYKNFVKSPDPQSQDIILQHNLDDICGLLQILPMLACYDLFHEGAVAKRVQANYYQTLSGEQSMELFITLTLPTPLPKQLSVCANNCYFSGQGMRATLKVPVYQEEMKYFYANYKDYYYLPEEDVALHKSVASFVDRDHRIQATAATCYTRKNSQYLQQWSELVRPIFKRDYNSGELFFELTDALKQDRKTFTAYANHVLEMILESN